MDNETFGRPASNYEFFYERGIFTLKEVSRRPLRSQHIKFDVVKYNWVKLYAVSMRLLKVGTTVQSLF